MTRKLLSAILIATMSLICNVARADEEVKWTDVATASEFKTAVKNNANVRLTNDIDLSSFDMDGDDKLFDTDFVFSGKINGKFRNSEGKETGHILMNCKNVIFQKMKDATIEYVTFYNCSYDGFDTGTGLLAIEAENTNISYVSLFSCEFKGDRNSCDCDQMGGLIGKAKNCHFSNMFVLDTKLTTDGQHAGLVVGIAENSKFDNIMTNITSSLWADGNDGKAYAGGICGKATGGSFTNCTNLALVCAKDDAVGGIVGHGDFVTITNCYNSGVVGHCDDSTYKAMQQSRQIAATVALYSAEIGTGTAAFTTLAFVFGKYFLIKALDAAFSYAVSNFLGNAYAITFVVGSAVATVIAAAVVAAAIVAVATVTIIIKNYEYDEAGGIAGRIGKGSKVLCCSNYGPVMCGDAFAGGIVGYVDGSDVDCCLNQNFIKGQEQAGGIVGFIKDGNVRDNINMSVVSAGETFGMIVGDAREGSNTVNGNYYLEREEKEDGGNYAVTQEQLASGRVAMNLNEAIRNRLGNDAHVFHQNLGRSIYPTLNESADEVTSYIVDYNIKQRVANAEEFMLAVTNMTAEIELTGDIDLTGNVVFSMFTEQYPFSGSIHGNGHIIKNMKYNAQENAYDNDLRVEVGLFSYTDGATFDNFSIQNFHIVQTDEWAGDHSNEAILVANSKNTTYKEITLANCDIKVNEDKDYLRVVGGMVALSENDNFHYCTVANTCQFEGHTISNPTCVGGLVASASGSTFDECYNGATIKADDDYNAGIVAFAEGCTIQNCMNTGTIYGKTYTAGIVGYGQLGTKVTNCVNTGTICGHDNSSYKYHAGIAGILTGKESLIKNTLNFGTIKNPSSNSGAIYGDLDLDASSSGYNMYLCEYDGKLKTNLTDENNKTWTEKDITSGAFACSHYDNNVKLYQSIDNGALDCNFPVPIERAGRVYSNILCDGTQSYSNIYNCKTEHFTVEKMNMCNSCGNVINKTAPESVEINHAIDLVKLSEAVSKGIDFSNSTVFFNNDIDFSGMNSLIPIGTQKYPFCGTFDGRGHCIKNMVIENYNTENSGVGFFGWAKGNTCIKNLAIDKTCVIRSHSSSTGAFVGRAFLDGSSQTLRLYNCGNEANVSGINYVGGLIGTAMAGENSQVEINNCYNTGIVNANENAAAACGYALCKTSIHNSWNAGNVIGYVNNYPFIYYENNNLISITNSYNLNTLNGSLDKISAEDVESGKLAFLLNGEEDGKSGDDAWYQEIGVDKHPYHAYNDKYDKSVFRHEFSYCNTPTVTNYIYTNSADDVPALVHTFNTKGICTAKKGEVHGEEPQLIDGSWDITKLGHLYWVANTVNSGGDQHDCVLKNNIADNEYLLNDYGHLNYQPSHEWIPIGTEDHPYQHSFYGNAHTISGLYARGEHVGLMGYMGNNSDVQNLGVNDSYFYGWGPYSYAGAIAGYAKYTAGNNAFAPQITKCYADATIYTSNIAGGLIGKYDDGDKEHQYIIKDSYSTCRIHDEKSQTGEKLYIGSLIGIVNNPQKRENKVSNSYYRTEEVDGLSEYGTGMPDVAFRTGMVCQLLGTEKGWTQSLENNPAPIFGSFGISYHRSVNANTWETIILPFEVSSTDEIQYYIYSNLDDNNNLHLTKAETVPANTPCFFKTSDDCNEIKYFISDIAIPDGNLVTEPHTSTSVGTVNLMGSYDPRTIYPTRSTANYYVAQNLLLWGEEKFSLPAFRAYLQIPNASNCKSSISIFVDGETTKIGEIDTDGNIRFFDGKYIENGNVIILHNGKKYNTNGQRLK